MNGFQNRTELSISSLTPGDIGNYTCSAAKDKSVSLGIIIVIIIISLLSLKQWPQSQRSQHQQSWSYHKSRHQSQACTDFFFRLGSGHHTVELTQRNLLTVRSRGKQIGAIKSKQQKGNKLKRRNHSDKKSKVATRKQERAQYWVGCKTSREKPEDTEAIIGDSVELACRVNLRFALIFCNLELLLWEAAYVCRNIWPREYKTEL